MDHRLPKLPNKTIIWMAAIGAVGLSLLLLIFFLWPALQKKQGVLVS